jgi:pyruvate dehydrogenase E1 component beta subunit
VPDFTVPFGKAKIAREGTDVTIVSFGIGMTYALEAAEELAGKEGIEAEVIDLRTLRPMDYRHGDRLGDEDQPLRDGGGRLPGRLIGNHMSATIMSRPSTISTRR